MSMASMFQSTHPCGVRLNDLAVACGLGVSIHAPVWGATRGLNVVVRHISFNPRTRVGCDRIQRRRVFVHGCFNPRTRVGCDTDFQSNAIHGRRFNPRTRVGCDNYMIAKAKQDDSFNPRTRVGCDCANQISQKRKQVSIHAPVWGATINR